MEKLVKWTVPSENEKVLKSLIGHKIIDLIKISYETFPEHISYLSEVGINDYRDMLSFFKYSFGGLLIIFDKGMNCYFGSAEDLNSIIMSYGDSKSYLEGADELTYVCNIDDNSFKDLLNKEITQINILSRNDLNSKQLCVPSEVGLEFVFENKKKLILSHNLTDNNFVFGVLTNEDIITNKITILKSLNQL